MRALVLLEPLSIRILDVINERVTAQVGAEREAGRIDAAQARSIEQALAGAIASLRATGTVAGTLPDGLATALNPTTQLYLFQEDRYNPAVVAAKLTPQLRTLLTCSNADYQVSCADVDHLAAGLAQARAKLNFVHLDGVDHVLKQDSSRTSAPYTKPLPFSTQLRTALRAFIATNL